MSVIVCRICLSYDVRMYSLINSPLQQIYEGLTKLPFQTEDGRPKTVCYICHHQLKKCQKFMLKSATSNEILSQLLSREEELYRHTLDMYRKQACDVSWCLKMAPVDSISLEPEVRHETEIHLKFVKIEKDTYDQPEYGEEETEFRVEAEVVKMEEYTFGQPKHEEEETEVGDETEVVKMEEDPFCQPQREEEDITTPLLDQPDHDSSDSEDDIPLRDVSTRSDVGIAKKICAKVNNNEEIPTLKPPKASSILSKGRDTNIKQEEHQNELILDTKVDEDENNLAQINKKAIHRNVDTKAQKENVVQKNKTSELEFSSTDNINNFSLQSLNQEKKGFRCDKCNKKFTLRCSLLRHYRIHTKEKSYECEICKKGFIRKTELKIHYRVHTKEKPYECDRCKKRFTTNGNLKRHYRTYTKEKPYNCEICKKRFTQNVNLKKHYCNHSKEKSYECEICKKRFSGSDNLKKHMQYMHTEGKPYVCDICKKSFLHNVHLKVHYRIHTKEKPYECDICKKRFTQNGDLKKHYRLHTKEKPYECEICKKRFNENGNLKKHYRTHN